MCCREHKFSIIEENWISNESLSEEPLPKNIMTGTTTAITTMRMPDVMRKRIACCHFTLMILATCTTLGSLTLYAEGTSMPATDSMFGVQW